MAPQNPKADPNDVLAATIAKMKAENEALTKALAEAKAAGSKAISMKVSELGGLSIYGLGRFPVTLYAEQWAKVLALDIKGFIVANPKLSTGKDDARYAAARAAKAEAKKTGV